MGTEESTACRLHGTYPTLHRVTILYTLSFDTIRTNDASLDIRTLAGSKDLNRDNLYRALTAPGVFTEEHPRLCFYMEHKYVRCPLYPVHCYDLRLMDTLLQPMDAEQKADSITQKVGMTQTQHLSL